MTKLINSVLLIFLMNGISSKDEADSSDSLDCDIVPKYSPIFCCKFENFIPKKTQELSSSISRPLSDKGGREHSYCKGSEILLEKLGVLKNDKINIEASDRFLDAFVKNKEFAELMKISVAECSELTTGKAEEYSKARRVNSTDCNPYSEMMVMCIIDIVAGVNIFIRKLISF
jgi:hypothetical protein